MLSLSLPTYFSVFYLFCFIFPSFLWVFWTYFRTPFLSSVFVCIIWYRLFFKWLYQVVHYTYITTSLLVLTFYQFQSSVITLPPFTFLCFSLFINVLNISCTCTEMLIISVATIQHNFKNSGRKVCWIYLYFNSFHCSSVLMSQNSPLYNFKNFL